MDEPFGAIDPITHARLQSDYLKILQGLKKTIVFVTHDIDEALRMGDRIAILRDGALVQFGTPETILAQPADAFVEAFVGTQVPGVEAVGAGTAHAASEPLIGAAPVRSIGAEASLRDALALMFSSGVDALAVVGAGGETLGALAGPHPLAHPYF